MENEQPTNKQIVVFAVVLSFIVSVIGTVLTSGIVGPLFSTGEGASGPVSFNKPGIIERITEKVTQRDIEERILRQDELVVRVVDQSSPAVVSIVASKDVPVIERFFIDPFSDDPFFRQFFGDSGLRVPQFRQKGTQKQEISSGTGFIISAEGRIITNKHVVSDSEAEYTALFNDGRKLRTKVMARDPLQDLAVLQVEGSKLPFVQLGNSDQVKIGQTVIAIGNALGEFRNTVSVGVISGLQRTVTASGPSVGTEVLAELIQTDAAINPGNSGGPLLNLRGEVVGINTAIASGAENIGFAIPVNKVKRVLGDVEKHGRVIYPFLGVRYVTVTPEFAKENNLARDRGAYITGGDGGPAVVSGSPAEKGGLKTQDIILEINGEILTTEKTLASVVQKFYVGDEITLKVFRKEGNAEKEMEVKVTLEERK